VPPQNGHGRNLIVLVIIGLLTGLCVPRSAASVTMIPRLYTGIVPASPVLKPLIIAFCDACETLQSGATAV
jgi:hypothetical protein